MYTQTIGWCLFGLLFSGTVLTTLAYPNSQPMPSYRPIRGAPPTLQQVNSVEQMHQERERKFAEKPNAIKKVALDDLDNVQTNQISESAGGGFSWSNLLGTSYLTPLVNGMLMQMIFNPGGGVPTGPNKSEGLDDGGVAPSPWANLITMGLKILSAILGGGAAAQNEGIDKVDNGGGSPLQFINIVVNLLDALKTSFSHRSLAARNLGRKDSVSDAAIAGISMMKGYAKSLGTDESNCMARYMCQANNECSTDIGQSSLFCHLGSYAASFVLDKATASTTFDLLYEAGRRGRSGDNCQQAYLECNEV
ncbi:uncharacterized protein LOC132705400 isoform X3 [Cylas formicarius]|uniref:uncharacterized protein LOC132705400 isoform X3 n=1 Tax=Cylas formicarius TaxID=197179 RepID=UPI002958333E|nr:uncharacterized protein LOC132705400 isoform X3 [Cylas formicarius]